MTMEAVANLIIIYVSAKLLVKFFYISKLSPLRYLNCGKLMGCNIRFFEKDLAVYFFIANFAS